MYIIYYHHSLFWCDRVAVVVVPCSPRSYCYYYYFVVSKDAELSWPTTAADTQSGSHRHCRRQLRCCWPPPPRALPLPPYRALLWALSREYPRDYEWFLVILSDSYWLHVSSLYVSRSPVTVWTQNRGLYELSLDGSLRLLVAIGGTATKSPDQRCSSFSLASILTRTWRAKCEKLESACFWPRANGVDSMFF
jgi:hypothetical protein